MKAAILAVCLAGFTQEGHVSQVHYSQQSLEHVVSRSDSIVEATYVDYLEEKEVYRYTVTSVVHGPNIKPGTTISVFRYQHERMKNMNPHKSPIVMSYRPDGAPQGFEAGKKYILFLESQKEDGTYEFAIHPGFTDTSERSDIETILAKPKRRGSSL